MGQKLVGGRTALKNTPTDRDASPDGRLFNKSESDHPDHDQVGRDDEIEQARDDQDGDAGGECDNWLQVSDADVPLGCCTDAMAK
jgi:hypothetical protein